MLKRILPALLGLFFFAAAHAQPGTAAAYYKSGIAYRQQNKLPEAIAAFEKAISLNKRFDSAYIQLGDLYFQAGNIDQSYNTYKKNLTVNPSSVGSLIGMGKVYRDAKKILDSALYFYHAAEKIDTRNKEIFYALAWTYNAKQEFDKAIPYGIKTLEIDNNYRPAYGELGYAYRSTKRFAEGAEQFKKNRAVSVVDVAILYTGYCYIELKDKAAALEQYEELKKINERMAANLKKKIDAMP